MTKKPYSDRRWHPKAEDFITPDKPEQFSLEEREKRRKFLNDLHRDWFGTDIPKNEIPDNLK